jgi:dUTP pyrophosphatase
MLKIKVKLSDENAIIPTRKTEYAAGLDLYAAHDLLIKAGDKGILDTGISMELPYGCYGRIAPRSAASYRNHFITGAGVIDADYRGTIKAVIFNLGYDDMFIRTGESHCQLILEKIYFPNVEIVKELNKSERMHKAEIDRYHFTQQLWKQAQN